MMTKIDRGKPHPKRRSKWKFDQMKPGDSFHFKGKAPTVVATAFGYYLAKGKYSIRREGDGYRFYLLNQEKD
jgi:hypothetical protein